MLGKFIQQARHYNGLDEKIRTLRNNIQVLSCRAADIKTEVEDAESRLGKKRKYEVENWLTNTERMKNEVQNIDQQVGRRKISSLLSGSRVDKLNGEIVQLCEQGRFPRGLLSDMCETSGEPLLTTKLIGHAFEKNMKKIFERLMDDKVLRIGIYGMGGVGKTTLVSHIHNTLLEKSETFGRVYWITIPLNFSIGRLQNDIAKCLNLDLSDEDDEKKRASKLSRELMSRKKIVFILDDVWNQIPLDKLGITNGVNGCKLILTTRSFDVCRRMDCQANFKVEPLSVEEGWNLFREKLGQQTTLSLEIRDIAMSLVVECAGLPLGIITMASSMRGVNDICEWRSVLEELKKLAMGHEDMETEVLPILKFSYTRLNDVKLQHCFLYCALYPEDCKIKRSELIRYFIVEGHIDERMSRQAKFDEGHTKLNKLERCCLLESCEDDDGNRCVKMHDSIRDMALKITKVSHPRFMVKAGVGLNKIPYEQEWTEDLDKVSLMRNQIREIPWGWSPRCPRLSTLILRRNPIRRIADSFFEHMHALQVLDLCRTSIVKLPNTISDLKNLTALLLGHCEFLTYVPPLGNLTALQELDLRSTPIKEVPQGVDRLVNLKILNMEGTENMEMIPSGTLGRLSHLQHVQLRCLLGPVEVQAEELEGLWELERFVVQMADVDGFKRFLKFLHRCGTRLNKYSLELHHPDCLVFHCETYKYNYNKAVKLLCFEEGGEGGILFPYDIQLLVIAHCRFASSSRLSDVFPSLNGNARHLKFCEIVGCYGIEYILSLCCSFSSSLTSFHNEEEREETGNEDLLGESCWVPFQSLEILVLCNLPDLRALFWPKLPLASSRVIAPLDGTFSKLKRLDISYCNKIDCLFTPGLLLQHLQNLEMIMIMCCDQMMEIFDDKGIRTSFFSDNDDNNHDSPIILPKLKKLLLYHLPKLKSICKGIMICDSIEVITVVSCPKLKRLPFPVPLVNGLPSAPTALKQINIDKRDIDWWESLEWEYPSARDVLLPFVSFVPAHG